MATTKVAAGSTMSGTMAAASFPFRPRNLILSSSSSFSPRSAVSPRRVRRLAMTSARMAMGKGLSVTPARRHGGGAVAASAAGSPQFGAGENENPYEILGISPLDEFIQVKVAYKRRRNDVESCCDREYLVKLDRAYDAVMMDQLLKRKKGEAYESIQVSKDIRYADYQPIVPWGPRYSRSTLKDLRINMAISAAFKWIFKQIDKIRHSFLWKGEEPENNCGGHCLVNWPVVTHPLNMGGLGIADLERFARALRLQWMWFQWKNEERAWVGLDIPCSKDDRDLFYASTVVTIMCISTLGHADWKPLQFLCFAYFYRILEKLKTTEPAITPIYNEYGAVEGQGIHMAKRVLRSVGLVLGSILAVSLGYTGLVIFSQFLGQYIPSVVYNFQYLIPGVDCDYSFIGSALHLSFVLPIAIGAGLEKTPLINDTSPSGSHQKKFARTD
ncbi:hypothetical protein U9M48_009474 [Paspalum notatum var. saurae]|uniref:Uncharacterized protein n=1 Tax=Paspalum notatum var. saurae TaxID=547442 RepID=A0AAQ3SR93_PASNO